MKSLWSLEREVTANTTTGAANTATGATNTGNITTLTTKTSSHDGVIAGSATMRVTNVASVPTSIPGAGVLNFDTTRKCLVVSDGTSVFLATGSLG